ncbi:MAG: 2-hydroxychromene-2-carboxylate isomerase-like protein [Solirubrobacterales bacterium]|jgi:2-hydroxychromene-2-carboxylate isomerase|nr:2-hydroxychromene-2-carboxylate isomerase-like protein [Solirubrobacterales bacterium]
MSDELPVSVHAAGGPAPAGEGAMPAFYLDLASPECYLTAERILTLMPVAVEWIPVHLSPPPPGDAEREAIAATALARGIQRVRWPPPFDGELANLTATYAKSIGRTVAFAQAALRQAYAGGRDLSVSDNVIIAASGCEMHPNAVLKSVSTRGVTATLATATAIARDRGVLSTPAIWIPPAGADAGPTGRVLHGDARLEDAAALLGERLG